MSIITTDIIAVKNQLDIGEIVAIPTETVYGLAANANNAIAIDKIYCLKQRPYNHPLIMHIASGWDLDQWATAIPSYVYNLIDNFWPGPLTLVLPSRKENICDLITGGQPTIAIRCPGHSLTQQLLHQLGYPLVAPSANPFGKISPTTAAHVQISFHESNLMILDGGRCKLGIESTIIDATRFDSYQILRHGSIDAAS
ncbi:MAG: threonylcarbamoyl-AMP synthase, partial [Legionellales bacterium RIFCSPHIGHO2_12_FULL_42_9]